MHLPIGQILLKDGAITRNQLEEAIQAQIIYGGKLGTILVELEIIDIATLNKALAKELNLPPLSNSLLNNISKEAIKCIEKPVAHKFRCIPLSLEDSKLKIAMENPTDLSAIDELSFITGKRISPYIAPEILIVALMEKYYDFEPEARFVRISLDEAKKAKETPQQISSLDGDGEELDIREQNKSGSEEETLEGALLEEEVIEAAVLEEEVIEAAVLEEEVIEAAVLEEEVIEDAVLEEEVIEDAALEEEVFEDAALEEEVLEDAVLEEEVLEDAALEEEVLEDAALEEEVLEDAALEEEVLEDAALEEEVLEDAALEEEVLEDAALEEEVLEDAALEEEVLEDAALEEEVLEDAALEEEVLEDAVLEEEVLEDAVLEEEVLEDAVLEEEVLEDAIHEEEVLEEDEIIEELPEAISLQEAISRLEEVKDRDELSQVVLSFALSYFKRSALFITRFDTAIGWDGMGRNINKQAVQSTMLPLKTPSIFKTVYDTQAFFLGSIPKSPINDRFIKLLGDEKPDSVFLIPILFKGDVVNILYGDNGEGEEAPFDISELLILAPKVPMAFEKLIKYKREEMIPRH